VWHSVIRASQTSSVSSSTSRAMRGQLGLLEHPPQVVARLLVRSPALPPRFDALRHHLAARHHPARLVAQRADLGIVQAHSGPVTGTLAIADSVLQRNRNDGFHTAGLPGIFFLAGGRLSATPSWG
jgi:hypothetical protein